MIGSWSNRIIEKSRCHMWDRHALDTFNPDVNYAALRLVLTDERRVWRHGSLLCRAVSAAGLPSAVAGLTR
jgi:hypothetical protein